MMKFRCVIAFAVAAGGPSEALLEFETGEVYDVLCPKCECDWTTERLCDSTCQFHPGSEPGADISEFYALLKKIEPNCTLEATIRFVMEVSTNRWCRYKPMEKSMGGLVVEQPFLDDLGLKFNHKYFRSQNGRFQLHQASTEVLSCSGWHTLAAYEDGMPPKCPVKSEPQKGHQEELNITLNKATGGIVVNLPDVEKLDSGLKRKTIVIKPKESDQIGCFDGIYKVEWLTTVITRFQGLAELPGSLAPLTTNTTDLVGEASSNVKMGLIVILLAVIPV